MDSLNSGSAQRKTGSVVIGLTILLGLIAAVVGLSCLPNPWYAVGEVAIYAVLVAVVAGKLRSCLRIAQGTEYSSALRGTVFWVVLGVFSVIAHLGDLFRTENRDYIRMATSGAVYLALLSSLNSVEQLLKRVAVGSSLPADSAPTRE